MQRGFSRYDCHPLHIVTVSDFMLNVYVCHQSCNSSWHMIWFLCYINQLYISVVPVTGATHTTRRAPSPSLFSLSSFPKVLGSDSQVIPFFFLGSSAQFCWCSVVAKLTFHLYKSTFKWVIQYFCFTEIFPLGWMLWDLFLSSWAPVRFAKIICAKLWARLQRKT